MRPRVPPIAVALRAAWIALAVAIVALYGGSAMDDFFITYRYAANLAAGNGFVFNPGERVFGLTEPAWGFLLGLLHAISRVPIPWIASILGAAGLVGLAWLGVADEIERGRSPDPEKEKLEQGGALAALVAGTLVVTLPLIWACRGAGVIPGFALLALAVRLSTRPVIAGFFAALAVGFRPEVAVGVGFAVLFDWIEERRIPWRFATSGAIAGAVGAVACRLWFGTWLPITMGAKRDFAAWDPAARASGAHFWPGFVPLLERHWGRTWPLYFAIAAVGCVLALRRGGRVARVLVATGIALAVVYPLLGVPLFGWYTIPTIVAALHGFAWATVFALRRAAALRPAAAVALGVVFVLLVAPSFRTLGAALVRTGDSPGFVAYREAGRFIAERSPPGATIGALEVGTLAYFSDRRVIDLLGLVSPDALANVAKRQVVETLRASPTDWFVLTGGLEALVGPVRSLPWFAERYELARELPGDNGQAVWVYRRKV